jgi:hypothetical protein
VAKKRRRKRRWLRNLLIFIMFPLAVWFIAFVLWVFWYDIGGIFRPDSTWPNHTPWSARTTEKLKPPPPARNDEKIFNEDRKTLEDIINKRR